MATKKAKLQAKFKSNLQQVSNLIDKNYDLIDIAKTMHLSVRTIEYYCAYLRKAPIVGDFDLNWYLNGYFIHRDELRKEQERINYNKPFRSKDDWFENL